MLSEQSAATVRATLPAVGAAIEQITERFYARLFDAHPELLRDLFNRGNRPPAPRSRPSRAPSPLSPDTWSSTRTSGRTRC